MKRTNATKKILLGKGRRPHPEHRFADLKRVGQTFTVDCAGMSAEEQKRKRQSLSSLCRYYGRKLRRKFGAEIAENNIIVQLLQISSHRF